MSPRSLLLLLLLLAPLSIAHAQEPRSARPAGLGTLQIVTKYWADVYVDGERVGRAPLRALPLPAGKHVVELRGNPRVQEYRQTVVIRPGETLVVSPGPQPVSKPEPATGGEEEAPQRSSSNDSKAPSGEQSTQQPRRDGQGSLRIVSRHWGEVWVDGKQVGRFPLPAIPLPAGKHVVELRGNPRVKDYRTEVVIRAGETHELLAPSTPRSEE